MYTQATSEFNNAIMSSSRTFKARITVDETVISEIKSFKLTRGSVSEDKITIGSTVSAYIEMDVETNATLEDKKFYLEVGLVLSDSIEYIPMGYFTVTSAVAKNGVVSLKASDVLSTLAEKVYETQLTSTTAIITNICSKLGITFTGSFSNYTVACPSGLTIRETIGYIAGLYGKYAVIDRNGQLAFKWYTTANYTIPEDSIDDPDLMQSYFTVRKLVVDNGTTKLTAGSPPDTGIIVGNPLMEASFMSEAFRNIVGFSYLPGKINVKIGDIRLDPWDAIVYNEDTLICSTLNIEYDGGISIEIVSAGQSDDESELDYKGPTQKLLKALDGSVSKFSQTLGEIALEVANSATKAELALEIGEDGIARVSAEADEIAFESDKFSLSSTNFSVSRTGAIKAKAGKIGAFYLTSGGALYSGSSSLGGTGTYMGKDGISCSNTDASSKVEIYNSAIRLTQNGTISKKADMPRIIFTGAYQAPGATDILRYSGDNSLYWTGGFQTAKDIMAGGGISVASTAVITGKLTAESAVDVAGKLTAPCIELSANKPYIDFHYGTSSADYTSRLVETSAGTLQVQVDALKISSVTSGECPIVRSSSGVMQFSSASDSYVNYISGSEVRVCDLARKKYKVIKASAFTVSSSRRLKHNIEPMSEDEALKLQKLNVVTFDYNNGEAKQRGLIAEDTYEIIPSAVQGNINAPNDDEDAVMGIGIDYSKLVPYLIKNVQMQEKRIKALEEEIEQLKTAIGLKEEVAPVQQINC